MRELPEAELVAGRGIKGDRYFLDQGTYSFIAEAGRQLTMISAEGAQAALAAKGIKVEPLGKLRRNVHLLGISCSELLDLRGLLVEVGPECRVFVHRNNVPCAYNEAKNGRGLMDAIWNEAGVNCEIIRGGIIRPGDKVHGVAGSYDPKRCEDGGKGDTFYLRPKLRTVAQVKAGKLGLAALHERLLQTDPGGVARVQAAYATVGLSFFPREGSQFRKSPAHMQRGSLALLATALLTIIMGAMLAFFLRTSPPQ